jgi:hypothetical protein
MKSRTLLLMFLAVCGGHALAQSVVIPSEEKSQDTLPDRVFVENTLGGTTTPVMAVEKKVENKSQSAVYFTQSFTSETSQDAIVDMVVKAITKDPDHACEITKEAIVVSKADEKLVARIVESAALAAPEKMRLIAQCAIATSPDSLSAVQLVLAKLDPGAGDTCISGKECSGKEISEKGAIDEKGGGTVIETPPTVYDPLRRIYVRPRFPIIIPSTNNNLRYR